VDIAREHPFGVGLGRAGAVVNARIDGTEEFAHVHNLWLNWLVETGALGLLAITAITVGALVTTATLAKKDIPIGYAGFAALLGFLTMSLVDHPANLSRISVAFWMVLGVVMGSAPARFGDQNETWPVNRLTDHRDHGPIAVSRHRISTGPETGPDKRRPHRSS
jgi:O-antigen ligase